MTTLLVILFVVLVAALVVLLAAQPERTRRSMFELKRSGEEAALRRERLLEIVFALARFLTILIVALIAVVAVTAWQGWGVGVTVAVLVIAIPVSRILIISRYANRWYGTFEPKILEFIEKWPAIKWFVLEKHHPIHDQKLESTEHLLHLVETSGHVLSDGQRTIIKNGIDWHKTPVSAVMTKRSEIVSVKHSDVLGPLVLDDLHRSGHSRFPVMKGSLNVIIGTLDITDLLELNAGKSTSTAEKMMSTRVLKIKADETLSIALGMLQKSHQYIAIVIDASDKTVGLVTLQDITKRLVGWRD